MTWREVSMIDERKKFALEATNPSRRVSFTALCEQYNISTKTGYKWLNRFRDRGIIGLEDLSRAPLSNSCKISPDVEEKILFLRHQYPKWGPKKLYVEFQDRFEHLKPPSEGSIGNILNKNGLSTARIYRRHVAQTASLKDCQDPNDVWMYDFKGWFLTADGKKCEPLTITDGATRYLFQCEHMHRKRGCDVWNVLTKTFNEFGLPHRIRSDNGPPFASLGLGRLSNLAIKLIKVGITPEWIEPGCPQQNGRHERFHLTLKEETAKPPALTLQLQMQKFKQFKKYYNEKRYHEALGQKTPGSLYKPSLRVWDGKFRSPDYPDDYEVRKVGASGNISWKGSTFFISEMLIKENIGIKETAMDVFGLYYGPILLGQINLNKGFIKK